MAGILGRVEQQAVVGDANDDARKSVVADEEVAAAAEDERGNIVRVGKAQGFEDLRLRLHIHEPASWAAYAEGGVLGQRDIFENPHAL